MQSANTYINVALMQLDSLIAGMETNSSIPVQLSELKTLKILLTTPEKPVVPVPLASVVQPTLRAVPMGLFPTFGSLQDVVDLARAKFPVEQHNDVLGLLYTYHNSLLAQLKPK